MVSNKPYTISKSKLLMLLGEQQSQDIQFVDECGKSKVLKSNSSEYQKLYYSSEFKKYEWKNGKYVVNNTKIWPEWNNLTQTQKDLKLRARCSGKYSEEPNLISTGVSELIGNASEFLHTFGDYLSIAADFIIPGSGAVIDALNTLAYLFEASLATDSQKQNELYLMAAVAGVFIVLPGPAQSFAPAIKKYIKTKVMTKLVEGALRSLFGYVDRMVIGLQTAVSNAVKSPLAKTILGSFSLNSINNVISNLSTTVKNIINRVLPKTN
jgi:hypothetical protein